MSFKIKKKNAVKLNTGAFAIVGAIVLSTYQFNPGYEAAPMSIFKVLENRYIMDNTDFQFEIKIKEGTEELFKSQEIPQHVAEKMNGVSWRKGAPVGLDELRYLSVTYLGFDGKSHVGELVVHEKVAEEVLEIFKELYDCGFQIEKMKLIDEYGAEDNKSMADNNSSAFCFRNVDGSSSISKHSYGVAIDINPVQNPYIRQSGILPEMGKDYIDRKNIRNGMITKGDACYNAFKSRGWTWGGEWKSLKDYQHFEKKIDM